jgi:hypothetical protein
MNYVAPEIRERVKVEMVRQKSEFENMSVQQLLDKLLSEKRITQKQADLYQEMEKTFLSAANTMTTIEQFNATIKAFDQKVANDVTASDAEKLSILRVSSMFRNYVDYRAELELPVATVRNTSLQTRDDCFLGRRLDCWLKTYGRVALVGLAAASSGTEIAVVVAVINEITAFIDLFTTRNCDCDQSGSCFILQGISFIFERDKVCGQNQVRFQAWGQGTLPLSYDWNVRIYNEQGQIIRTLSVTTSTPFLDPIALDPSNKVVLSVKTICNGTPVTQELPFTLDDIINGPGEVFVSGPTTASRGETCMYLISGSCLINPLNTFEWFPPNSAGTVTSMSRTNAQIRWTGSTNWGGYYVPSTTVRSTNGCSQRTSSGGITVRVN